MRAFQTWYSPTSGEYGELLLNFQSQIEPRLLKLDALRSRIDQYQKSPPQNRSGRQKYKTLRTLRKKWHRELRRHRGWMESAHYCAANFILKKFDLVIQPWLHCAQIVQKSKRNIGTKSERNMLTMNHYKYRERLQSASAKYPGRHVIVTENPERRKRAPIVVFWYADLGASKVFHCPCCSISVERDMAGARNNFFGAAIGVGWDGQCV